LIALKKAEHSEYSQETEGAAFLEVEKEAQTLNTGMTGLGASPLKVAKISPSSKVSYRKRI